jgi:hypothetical protein
MSSRPTEIEYDTDLLRAALRKIAYFDFAAGSDVDDMMAFADRVWRGTLGPEEVDELQKKSTNFSDGE